MNKLATLFILLLLISACSGTEDNSSESSDYSFVTRLGNDTLAMENISVTENGITADVILRSPEVRRGVYSLSLNDGELVSLEAKISRNDSLLYIDTYTKVGDSLAWSRTGGERDRSGTQAYQEGVLPFIDMVHWPFDIMTPQVEGDTVDFPVFSGSRGFAFKLWKKGPSELIIRHPSRGEMDVILDQKGQIQQLNASRTTRKLVVSRTGTLDLDSWEDEYMNQEAGGKKFGALSGRGSGEFSVLGANITVDYGQPMKRGRDVWGKLVPYGARWRTGANRATHFKTDRDLTMGELDIPAGEYTFFSIPEENSLTLIINKQTGQNGRTYNEENDLGRVEMQYKGLDTTVEPFTILVTEEAQKGTLHLQWDKGEYVIDFAVK